MAFIKQVSFRNLIMIAILSVVSFVSLCSIYYIGKLPWDSLYNQIDQGNNLLSILNYTIPDEDLQRMNEFAYQVTQPVEENDEDYLTWTFGMLIVEEELLNLETIQETLLEKEKERLQEELDEGTISQYEFNSLVIEYIQWLKSIDYKRVEAFYIYWEKMFENDSGLIDIVRKHKTLLFDVWEAAQPVNFQFDDVYLMVHDEERLLFLIDGSEWFESTYMGQDYDVVEEDQEYFLEYSREVTGYYHTPPHGNMGAPEFDSDQWGTFFSTWMWERNGEFYNNFSMDFDASQIKTMMWKIGGGILISIALITIVVLIYSTGVSNLLSKPLNNLVLAANAVIDSNYTFRVPPSRIIEYNHVNRVVNEMIVSVKERDILVEALTALLSSKALVDKILAEGLDLSSEEQDLTVFFSDIRAFSAISGLISSDDLSEMLDAYYGLITLVIPHKEGLIDKFIGDAIVSIFGYPLKGEYDAINALHATIIMQRQIRQLNQERTAQGKAVIWKRFGINSGNVFVGAIGSRVKKEITTIGDMTNKANRYESESPVGHICIGEETYRQILEKRVFFDGVFIDPTPHELTVKGMKDNIIGHFVYVDNLYITADKEAARIEDVYTVTETDLEIVRFHELNEYEQSQYDRVIDTHDIPVL